MAVPKKGGKSREGLACLAVLQQGQGLGGKSKDFGSGRVGVLFFESWRVDLVTCSRRGLPRGATARGGQGLRFRGG